MQYQGKENLELENGLDSNNFYSLAQCPICKCDSSLIDSVNTINPSSKEKFDLRECSSCHHWWIDPMPIQSYLNILYGEGSPYVVEKIGSEFSGLPKSLSMPEESVLNHELELNQGNLSGLKYLEIGIGDGNLFNAFRERGSVCSGVEPGDSAKRFENIYRSIDDLPRDTKFDVIVINDVLEHLGSPKVFLEIFALVSHSQTCLHCSFPNKSSLRAFIGKGSWRMVRPIGHLHYFSDDSVRLLFKLAGWKIVSLKKTDLFNLARINFRRNPIKNLVGALIELLSLGDQWVVRSELDESMK
jgi:2-polyprenyl-3-methyl-5-hydroxy-6-metoxy-1,4-benzoquinol methylase